MKRIRKGDEVIVIAGKAENKGQRGTVLKVANDYVVVDGINHVLLSQIVNCRRKAQS